LWKDLSNEIQKFKTWDRFYSEHTVDNKIIVIIIQYNPVKSDSQGTEKIGPTDGSPA